MAAEASLTAHQIKADAQVEVLQAESATAAAKAAQSQAESQRGAPSSKGTAQRPAGPGKRGGPGLGLHLAPTDYRPPALGGALTAECRPKRTPTDLEAAPWGASSPRTSWVASTCQIRGKSPRPGCKSSR